MRPGPRETGRQLKCPEQRAPKISEDQTGYRTVSRDWCDRPRGSEGAGFPPDRPKYCPVIVP